MAVLFPRLAACSNARSAAARPDRTSGLRDPGLTDAPIQSAVSPGRAAGAHGEDYGWGCCRIVVSLSPLLPTANSGPPVRPDRLPPVPEPPATLKPAGSALAGGTAVHWVP